MNALQVMSLMSQAMPIIVNFEVLKKAKTAKAKKSALKELTAQVMEMIDDFTPLKITDRKKLAVAISSMLDTLEFEDPE